MADAYWRYSDGGQPPPSSKNITIGKRPPCDYGRCSTNGGYWFEGILDFPSHGQDLSQILDFFCDNDILLHLVSTVLEAKYEIYIENIRKKNVRITLRGVIPKAFCFKSLEPLATTMLGAFTNLEVKQFQGKCREKAFPVSLAEIPKKMRQSKSMASKVFEIQ
ncbi:hypothetical protein ACFX11_033432 [Malus domestica]